MGCPQLLFYGGFFREMQDGNEAGEQDFLSQWLKLRGSLAVLGEGLIEN